MRFWMINAASPDKNAFISLSYVGFCQHSEPSPGEIVNYLNIERKKEAF